MSVDFLYKSSNDYLFMASMSNCLNFVVTYISYYLMSNLDAVSKTLIKTILLAANVNGYN